jgi:predicted aspartyl protease
MGAMLAGLLTASCGGGSSAPTVATTFSGSCPTASPAAGGTGKVNRVPMKLVKDPDGGVDTVVPVCVAGHGPYPFEIDTGANTSTFVPQLVQQLHLPAAGPAAQVQGALCIATATQIAAPSWSVGTVALDPQTVLSIDVAGSGLRSGVAGLLGGDVLRRFGAVRIDYQHQSLSLPGPEGPQPTGPSTHGPTGAPIPQGIALPHPSQSIPLVVIGQALFVAVRFGDQGPHEFHLDTGFSSSAVDPQLSSAAGLRPTGKTAPETAVGGCRQNVPLVESGPWSVGPASLRPQPLSVAAVPGGVGNFVGTDVLRGFGVVVIGYAAGVMIVGSS